MKLRMEANHSNHEKSSALAMALHESGEINAGCNMSEDGSNGLILPGKRCKSNGKGKVSKHGKTTDTPAISKNNQRKLRKLQEEKEQNLMLSKSIKMLQEYKLRDEARSILQSSGTIGQAKSFREKRRLAVQYSKLGLEVPSNLSIFKKKVKVTSENDAVVRPNQCDLVDCSNQGLRPMKKLDKDDCLGLDSKKLVEINFKGTSQVKLSEKDINNVAAVTKLVATPDGVQRHPFETHLPSTIKSSISVNPESNKTSSSPGIIEKVLDEANKYATKLEAPAHFDTKGHVNSAIIVYVSRPHEVEEKRRELPIIMMEQEIMEAINEHSILILCGETGCGKTTQVPQFLYEAGYGSSDRNDRKGIIGITQPRRVAVLATAKRVSYELGVNLGKEVGYQVRHDKMIGNDCSIKFMTDGILVREAQCDLLLRQYSVIIIDEAHERSLNTDILIGMLSRIIKIRNDLYEDMQQKILSGVKISPENLITRLKLVLMSATMRVEDFVSNKNLFQEPPLVLEVPVRQFPVTIHFSRKTPEDYLGQAYKKVLSIHKRLPPGGILVFVTGQREVEYLCKKLRKASQKFCGSGVKQTDNEALASLNCDLEDINDAFWTEDNFPNLQTGRFISFEDDDFEDSDEYFSESEEGSDSVEVSEDERTVNNEDQAGNGSVMEFLNSSRSLSSLKAAFQALAGNVKESAEEKSDVPSFSHLKECPTESTAVVGPLYVLPLYAMLPASMQLRVFEEVPEGERLVVLATNVAETSLTIPGIKYVVDTGKEKVKNYNHGNGLASFEVQWISKASAAQRAGRAGRTAPGHCYRLYSSAAFSKDHIFSEFSHPEISKVPIDGVLLLMKFLGIHKVENFPFPTPPSTTALEEADRCLKAIGALDEKGELTSLGRAMTHYPLSPRHSRMIITVIESLRNQRGSTRANLVLGYAVAAVAALSFPDPFLMQCGGVKGTRKTEMKSRVRFCNPNSDALTIAYALQSFELAENTFEFCRNNSLHLKTMEEMSKLRKQVLHLIFHPQKTCNEILWNHGSLKDVEGAWLVYSSRSPLQLSEEELLAQAICTGWADRVSKRIRTISASSEKERRLHTTRYQSCAMADTVYLHRQSSVSRTAPEFVVYNELLCTNKTYMHGVTAVKSDWLIRCASSLCCFSSPLADPKPYYEPLGDGTFCWVNPTFGRHNWNLPLYSLPIKNEDLRVSVFACALLEGNVLPCLKGVKNLLAATPSIILRPEGLGHRRVVDLLRRLKMGPRTVNSRANLKEVWSENPLFLHPELQCWFQKSFHSQFDKLWVVCLQEVQLEGFELFPKRAKKDKKSVLTGPKSFDLLT